MAGNYDARWGDDPRDRSDHSRDVSRGSRGGSDPRESARERLHPREVFTRDLNLPRGLEREYVRDRGRTYQLRGSESRILSTVGAFRVVPASDLLDHFDRPADPRNGDLRRLRDYGLVETVGLDGRQDVAVVLTRAGRGVLESHRRESTNSEETKFGDGRERRDDGRQTFYAGLKKPRELEHDAQVYGAYLREAERLVESGASIQRVRLDYELKSEYQGWLHERARERDDYDGHHDRNAQKVYAWAREHGLPYFDEQVHFPDVRIEYELPDGRLEHEDIEIVTLHYRGAHGAAAKQSGFTCVSGSSARCGGGRAANPRFAEEFV